MKEDFKNLETQVLVDMLAQQTAELTAKIAEKNTVAIDQYEYEISLIQGELKSREQKVDPGISDANIEFTASN